MRPGGAADAAPASPDIAAVIDALGTSGVRPARHTFFLLFIPIAILSMVIAYPHIGLLKTCLWSGQFLVFLVVRDWGLKYANNAPLFERNSNLVGAWNAAQFGALVPMTFGTLSQTEFLGLTVPIAIASLIVPANYPRGRPLQRAYSAFAVLPHAIGWIAGSYDLSWVMGSFLLFLLPVSYLSASVGRRELNEIERVQAANVRLNQELTLKIKNLETINKSKTDLLAAACHDLRQPAHSMGLLIDLMESGTSDPDWREQILTLQRSNRSLVGMLSTLMDLARLDSGNLQANFTGVDLARFLDEVRLQFEVGARQKGVALQVAACDLQVRSDAYLLRRIVFNLVANALKYTPQGGSVTVTAAKNGTAVVLNVEDTGIGIAADAHSRIFDEYTRLDEKGEGLGIGLSVVKRACALLEHPLVLTSEPGVGTQVRITLAAATPGAAAAAPDADPADRGAQDVHVFPRRPLVAMAEDDSDARRAASALLQSWGYDVLAAAASGPLMEQLQLHARLPDLLITDLHLMQDDGFSVVQAVRALPGLADLPVLMMTGDLDRAVAQLARERRITLIYKPVASRRLREVASALLPR